MKDTIYPPSVEQKLNHIVESSKMLRFGDDQEMEFNEQCVRDVFGEVLLKSWFDGGEDFSLSEEEIHSLFAKAAAMTVIESLISKGLIDLIEDENGREMVFATQRGKDLVYSETKNTHNGKKRKTRKKS